jgi:hypothetical protein
MKHQIREKLTVGGAISSFPPKIFKFKTFHFIPKSKRVPIKGKKKNFTRKRSNFETTQTSPSAQPSRKNGNVFLKSFFLTFFKEQTI